MDHLFSKGDTASFFSKRSEAVVKYINGLAENYVLNVNEDDFIQHVISEYSLEAPVLHVEDAYTLGAKEIDIDVSQDRNRLIFDRSRPFYLKGSLVTIVIPFDGDGELFDIRPSQFNYNPPRGKIRGQELYFTFQTLDQNPEVLRQQYERELHSVQNWLSWIANDVTGFNQSLEGLARRTFLTRKEKLLAARNMVRALGIPLKRRDGISETYSVPLNRRKVKVNRPAVRETNFQPEPAIDQQQYDEILSVLRNMVLVMERSPSAFVGMGEEDLRTHFLVQLNGLYEGGATGETFNFKGKTDILLNIEGRNVFIAECKFWKGDKVFTETIDQLLGYLSWRDTKTAILLFNRNKEFSNVLNKIPSLVEEHPHFKKSLGKRGETEFRYIFRQPNDSNREIFLTVMAFDVPTDK